MKSPGLRIDIRRYYRGRRGRRGRRGSIAGAIKMIENEIPPTHYTAADRQTERYTDYTYIIPSPLRHIPPTLSAITPISIDHCNTSTSELKPLQISRRSLHRLIEFPRFGPVTNTRRAFTTCFAADDLGDGTRPFGGGGALLACFLPGVLA